MRVFGPVPSRRLGKSLGVNNIPHKVCSYSCMYCQLGKAVKMQSNRQEFYQPDELVSEVKKTLLNIKNKNQYPDYITIVPDGEPTLDINLGILIEKLKQLNFPVAVVTNGSLIQFPDVQRNLFNADYISIKIDTVIEPIWQKINTPCKELKLNDIITGINSFVKNYTGKLVTETMLLKGINDTHEEINNTATTTGKIKPDIAYIAIPTRPPAFIEAEPTDEVMLIEAFEIFKQQINNVEMLTGYEGNAFSSTGNLERDILSISAVHPLREDAIFTLHQQSNNNISVLNRLIDEKNIKRVKYKGYNYFLRIFTHT